MFDALQVYGEMIENGMKLIEKGHTDSSEEELEKLKTARAAARKRLQAAAKPASSYTADQWAWVWSPKARYS